MKLVNAHTLCVICILLEILRVYIFMAKLVHSNPYLHL